MPSKLVTMLKNYATKTERVAVFVAITFIIMFTYSSSHYAAVSTLPDPDFQRLVQPNSTKLLFKTQYLYVPLLFQFIGWLAAGTSLLPFSIQESWVYATDRMRRPVLYWLLFVCSIISALTHANASNAMRAAAATVSIDHHSSTPIPNVPK